MSESVNNQLKRVKTQDLTEKKFGKWTVVQFNGYSKWNCPQWLCICECGYSGVIIAPALLNGKSNCCKHCRGKKHGLSRHPLYSVWEGMLRRCNNKKSKNYKHYGGRGVRVCERWHQFINFYNDVIVGYQQGLKLDRTNNDGNYEPDNIKWSTQKEQINNRRNTIILTIGGVSANIEEWSKLSGTLIQTIYTRYFRGYSDGECVYGRNKTILN